MNSVKKFNHQDFDIQSPRFQLVRQDRIDCDPERHTVRFDDGKTGRVVNFSSFGLGIETTFLPEDNYSDCVFLVDGHKISELALTKVRQYDNITGTYTSGFSIIGNPLDVEGVKSIKALNQILTEASVTWAKDSDLREGFRLRVLEIREVLTRLQDEINALGKSSFHADNSALMHYEDRIASRVSQYMSQTLSPLYDELKNSVQGLSNDDLTRYFDYFRRGLGEIMYQSAYAHRAFFKPRGYAGDFEMMNHVYQRELRGDTLFGKCLQRYFVDEPAGRAVRNREVYLRRKIKEYMAANQGKDKINILSVASGPAMEVQNLVADPNFDLSRVEFHLLDQDTDALKHAQRRILESALVHGKTVNLRLHNLAIKNVIQEGLPMTGFSIIYSAGLFDYFTDPVAVYAATQLFQGLVPGGKLIIGNFSLNNPNQFAMGLIMDWNLIYRSEQKMKELFGKIGSGYSLEQEEQGINLFANINN